MTDSQIHWLILFTALVAIAVLVQALALGGIAFMVVKLLAQVNTITTDMKGKLYPVLDDVKVVVNDSVPKIKRVTDNIADTSDVYRSKLAEVDSLISDVTRKARNQTDRVDNIVGDALTSAGRVAGKVERGVTAPIRQGAAILNAIKVAGETLVDNYKSNKAPRTPKPVAFEGESIYTGLEDDYHA